MFWIRKLVAAGFTLCVNAAISFAAIFLVAVFAVGFAGTSFAQQYDAPYLVYEKKHKDKWAAEDKQIDKKLAALEKKFGKKPNIIMVLADDVGWGVLGSYGGGKVIGTPTPQLDKMARDGMKFLSAYSEPSCTPTGFTPSLLPVKGCGRSLGLDVS